MNRLLSDNREQLPLTFHSTENYEVVNESYSFGDYNLEIDGKVIFSFERKNPGDLASTIMGGHERFVNEINRAKEAGVPFVVVVECSYNDFINKKFPNGFRIKVQGYVLAKILHTMMLHYNIQFLFFNNREEMRDYIRNTFVSIVKEHEKKLKSN